MRLTLTNIGEGALVTLVLLLLIVAAGLAAALLAAVFDAYPVATMCVAFLISTAFFSVLSRTNE